MALLNITVYIARVAYLGRDELRVSGIVDGFRVDHVLISKAALDALPLPLQKQQYIAQQMRRKQRAELADSDQAYAALLGTLSIMDPPLDPIPK